VNPRQVASVAAAAVVVIYAWFATGVRPFHSLSYVVIALPIVLVVGLYVFTGTFSDGRSGVTHYYHGRSLGVSLSSVTPWIVVLVGAIVLEVAGLILGGRSTRVPTLSTLTDHLLTTHALRCVLFVLWLAVGVAPLRRLLQRRTPGLR